MIIVDGQLVRMWKEAQDTGFLDFIDRPVF
jgi:hypothetical protein